MRAHMSMLDVRRDIWRIGIIEQTAANKILNIIYLKHLKTLKL